MKIKLSAINSTYNPSYQSASVSRLVQKVDFQLAELQKKSEHLKKLQTEMERKVKFNQIMGTCLVASYVKTQQEADGSATIEELYFIEVECDNCSFLTALSFEGNKGYEEVHYRIHLPIMDHDLENAARAEILQLTDIGEYKGHHDPKVVVH